ncbi:sulfotransferase [Marinibacterium profundimaris]|uniref:Sulfotransferase n=1 Tax=Marinibacterium profundimaris TaxID=1679460 RepID=A0A225NBU2_9RHOB|nr:sulfotransferase [Marinibacterium profundimaris]MAU94913.1 hypothetical protein [Fulvimarina sp.]OWU68387.1 hypothetical protein ATO3_24180 [Marinibacterium profundimaris]
MSGPTEMPGIGDTAPVPDAEEARARGPRRRDRLHGMYPEDGRTRIVYILGSSRSGTSALRNALARTRYNGYGEGHMQPLLSRLSEEVLAYGATTTAGPRPGNARAGIDREALLRHLFRGYEAYLSEQRRSGYLLDKTPTSRMVAAVPLLNRYHQDAKFIFCARRHVDNVQSKIRKFSGRSFEAQCRVWARCNRSWATVKEELEGNYLAFDFNDLAVRPGAIAARIAAYLELPPEEEAGMAAYLVSERPQAASATRDPTRFLKFSELDWTEAEKETFVKICGPVGDAMGYGYESYFRETEPACGGAG